MVWSSTRGKSGAPAAFRISITPKTKSRRKFRQGQSSRAQTTDKQSSFDNSSPSGATRNRAPLRLHGLHTDLFFLLC